MDHNSLTVCGVLNGPDLCRAILCFCERIEWVSSGGETKFEGCVSMSEDRTSLSLLSLECSCLMAFFFCHCLAWNLEACSQAVNILTYGLPYGLNAEAYRKEYLSGHLNDICVLNKTVKDTEMQSVWWDVIFYWIHFFFSPSWSLGVEFHLALLSIAKLFDFTHDLQKEILERWDLFSVSLICSELRG